MHTKFWWHGFDDFFDHLGIEIDHFLTVVDSCTAFAIDFSSFYIGDFHAELSENPQRSPMNRFDFIGA